MAIDINFDIHILSGSSMSRIEEAIHRLETITDRHICFSRREELQEIISLLKEELECRNK